jgi:hypothetical protein
MLTEFKSYLEEDCLAGCIDNVGYRIEKESPSAERHGALVLAHGSESSDTPHGDFEKE